MSIWGLIAIGAAISFLIFYADGVRLYLQGQGREHFEAGVKALLTLKENGGKYEVAQRGKGAILCFYRENGRMNEADLRLKIPLQEWSSPFREDLKRAFIENGYELISTEGSFGHAAYLHSSEPNQEWILEVRIPVEDIWAVGSASRGAEAANLALNVLGFGKDARFNLYVKGKPNWRLGNRPA